MNFSKDELITAISDKDQRIKNYFDTFGFIVIRKMINKSEYRDLKREYDTQ